MEAIDALHVMNCIRQCASLVEYAQYAVSLDRMEQWMQNKKI